MRGTISLFSTVFVLLLLSCIPSEAPKPEDGAAIPAVKLPDGGANADAPAVAASTETKVVDAEHTQVAISMPDNPLANAMVQVEKREGGGFIVRGNLGLSGVIRRLGNQWRFDGRFRFPTAGYSVGELSAVAIGTMHFDAVGATLESPVDQYIITIPVALPPESASTAQVIEEVPIALDIDAPENADFIITLSQL